MKLFALFLRFRLHFEKESKEEVERRKKLAMETVLKPVSDKELEVSKEEIYPSEKGIIGFFSYISLKQPR